MKLCSCCKNENDRHGQRYCKACHAAYMREHRAAYAELSDEAKKKAIARSYAKVYRRRGKLKPEPCFVCSDPVAEMHHEDYDKPLDVLWLCRPCHLSCHNFAPVKSHWKKAPYRLLPAGGKLGAERDKGKGGLPRYNAPKGL